MVVLMDGYSEVFGCFWVDFYVFILLGGELLFEFEVWVLVV